MEHKKTAQVLILGSGLAGLTAAIKLLEQGLHVTILTDKDLGKASNTSYSMGLFSAPVKNMSKEEHYNKTLKAGGGNNDKALVKTMIDHADEAFEYIRKIGLPISETQAGYKVDTTERPIPGALITDVLADKAEQLGAELLTFHMPIELIIHQERCRGVLAIDKSGDMVFVEADNVLLATGGFAGAVTRNDNPPNMLGGGLILAYRAGAKLRDLEYIQYYPLGFYERELPQFMVLGSLLPQAKLYNDQGEDLLTKYLGPNVSLKDAISLKRDVLSVSLEKEWQNNSVWMDITERRDPYQGPYSNKFDFNHKPFRVRPIAHFTMGGVCINTNGKTDIPGLYAAGEVTGGLHGTNRLGGNALTEALTFGYIAANSIASESGSFPSIEFQDIEFQNPLLKRTGLNLESLDSSAEVKQQITKVKDLFWKGLSPIRDSDTLTEALKQAENMWSDTVTNNQIYRETFILEHTLMMLILTVRSQKTC